MFNFIGLCLTQLSLRENLFVGSALTPERSHLEFRRSDGVGAALGPVLSALPFGLHLRQEKLHPFEFKQVSLMNGEQHADEFGKINLIRKVPALQDGDFCLAESVAILVYLAEKLKTPDFWYPADLQQHACINEYLSWQHMAIRMHGSKIFWFRLLIPKILGVDVPQEKMDAATEDLNGSLKLFEEKFLQDVPFIVGDHITLADLVAIVEIMQPLGSGLEVFEGRPKLSAWRDRVQAAIGKELFDEAHQNILGTQESVMLMDTSKMQAWKPKVLIFVM